jgi:hypothetical protein
MVTEKRSLSVIIIFFVSPISILRNPDAKASASRQFGKKAGGWDG